VLLLRGNGTSGFFEPTHFPSGGFPIAIISADLDEDGHLDVAVVNCVSDVSLLLGRHRIAERAGSARHWRRSRFACLRDFDEDGHLDLAIAYSSGRMTLFFGNGRGGFPLDPPSRRSIPRISRQPTSTEAALRGRDEHSFGPLLAT
jgi:hypothetical protein